MCSQDISELRGKLSNAQARCLQMDEDRTTLLDQLQKSKQSAQYYKDKHERMQCTNEEFHSLSQRFEVMQQENVTLQGILKTRDEEIENLRNDIGTANTTKENAMMQRCEALLESINRKHDEETRITNAGHCKEYDSLRKDFEDLKQAFTKTKEDHAVKEQDYINEISRLNDELKE